MTNLIPCNPHAPTSPPFLSVKHTDPQPWFYAVGVDLGSVNDSTAITVLEVQNSWEITYEHDYYCTTEKKKERDLHYVVRLLHRPRLGTDYPKIIEQVRAIMQDLPAMPEKPVLAVDATGLGTPVLQEMRKLGMTPTPIGITITAGNTAELRYINWSVPKALLVGELRLMMHRKRLKIAQGFAARETLANELAAFTARLSPSGRATFEAAGNEHDDTVLSLSLALIAAKNRPGAPRGYTLNGTRVF